MTKTLLLLLMLILLPVVFADPSFYYMRNEPIDLKVPCINDGQPCSDSAECNITINYPNSTLMINTTMTNSGDYHNLTVNDTNTNGEYQAIMFCLDSAEWGYSTFSYMINNSGNNERPSSFLAIIILIPMILSILFLVGGATLGEEHNALRIFLFLLSMTCFFSSMYLGAVNIVQFYNFEALQDAVSTNVFIYGVILAVIIFYFMMYIFYKIIKTIAKAKAEKMKY